MMPKIDMQAYAAAKPMGSPDIVPGCYVARITEVKVAGYNKFEKRYVDYITEKEYVKVLFDIAEGEYAGAFSGAKWQDEDNDSRHCFYLSWKNLSSLKSTVEAIEESNPGFDPMAAVNADRWDMFNGRLVGLRWGDEEKEVNGEIRKYMSLPNLCSVQEVRSGTAKTPNTKQMKKTGAQQTKPAANYDDIPF